LSKFYKFIITAGILVGMISIILSLGLWQSDRKTMFDKSLIPILGIMAGSIFSILYYKRANGKRLVFAEGVVVGIATFILAYIVYSIWLYVLLTKIDPELVEISRQKSIDLINAQLQQKKIKQYEFDNMIQAYKEADNGSFIKSIIIGGVLYILFSLVPVLITSSIARTDNKK